MQEFFIGLFLPSNDSVIYLSALNDRDFLLLLVAPLTVIIVIYE
jgi:hypothetical protein